MEPDPEAEEEHFPEPVAPAAKAKAKAKAKAEPKPKGIKNIPKIWGSKNKAFICVDVFSKKVFVEPVDGTTSKDAVEGMRKAVFVMGPPKEVYSDDGGEFKGEFKKYLDGQGIKHIVTRRHAMFAERFTRYLRWHLRRRQVKYKKIGWTCSSTLSINTTKATKPDPCTQQPRWHPTKRTKTRTHWT